MPISYIALGGNLGPVEESFHRAVELLHADPSTRVLHVSSVFRTNPIGSEAGAEFLNAAAQLESDLSARQLLKLLHVVEQQLGRRRECHWGPRTLDLDLIFHGEEIIDEPGLVVPHAACWYRRFVLDPLAEIAPNFTHPQKEISVAALQQRLMQRPFVFGLAGGEKALRSRITQQLSDRFPGIVVLDWESDRIATQRDAVLWAWLGAPSLVSSSSVGFASLPIVPRLDASQAMPDPFPFLSDVLLSALG